MEILILIGVLDDFSVDVSKEKEINFTLIHTWRFIMNIKVEDLLEKTGEKT